MASPGRRRQLEKSQETRRELLAACMQVFARSGYAAATIAAITSEAGYAKGSFYRHWPSKEDAFFALIDEGLQGQQEGLRAAWAGAGSVTQLITEGFRAMAVATAMAHWNVLFAELWAHAARNEQIRRRLTDVYGRWVVLLRETIAQLQAAGQVAASVNPHKVAAITMALFDGYNVQRVLGMDLIAADDLASVLHLYLAVPTADRLERDVTPGKEGESSGYHSDAGL